MPRFQIGVRLESLGLPFRKAIETAARIGVQSVRFDAVGELSPSELSQTGIRELKHFLRRHSLVLSAIGFPTRHGLNDLDQLDERVAAVVRAFDFAQKLGAPIVINHVGKSPENLDLAPHFTDALVRIGSEADRFGIRFALETGFDPPIRINEILQKVNQHGLGVQYDPANLLVKGCNIYEGIGLLNDQIVGVDIKDAVRSGVAISGFVEVPVGEGEINWTRFLGELDSIGFHGVCTIERESGANRVDDVTKAFRLLNEFR